MNEDTREKILKKLVRINQHRNAIVKLMEIIDNSIATIKALMKEVEGDYNNIFIEVKKQ